MEMRHLRLVQTLALEGTLTSAGKILHLSQSALSHQLREIEEEMGVPLFQRLRKRMVLTEAGRRVVESADVVLGEIQRVRMEVRRMALGEAGTLRIAACCHTCFHWLPSVLRTFKEACPAIDVQIDTSASHDPKGQLLVGAIDLAIVNVISVEPRIIYTKLFDDEMVALVHRDHAWARKNHVTPKHFASEHLINYDIPVEEVVFYQRVLMPAGVSPKSLTKLPMTDAIVEMVRAGMGVAVLNLWSVRSYLESSELKAIRVTKNGFKRVWHAATLRDDRQPAYIGRFIDCLAAAGSPRGGAGS